MSKTPAFLDTALAVWIGTFAVALASSSGRANAGDLTIYETNGQITVNAQDTSVDEILLNLANSHSFNIERFGPIAPTDTISVRTVGSLRHVLTRVLKNENHLIIHSTAAKNGISRLVLFGARVEPTTATAAGTPQAQPKPPQQAPHAQSANRTRVTLARTRVMTKLQPKPLPREVISPEHQPAPAPTPPPAPSRTRAHLGAS
jgi:hypothetical protein